MISVLETYPQIIGYDTLVLEYFQEHSCSKYKIGIVVLCWLTASDTVHATHGNVTWLHSRANGTIDPWYQCDIYSEMIDYAINFTFPWYVLPDARTRAAIHAPTSKDWVMFTSSVFTPTNGSTNPFGDPSVEKDRPMAFLTDLATNATVQDMKIILYSGNDDSLIPHFGTQIVIQNTTFGGIQGFTRRPETPWCNDAGEFAGIVHQERSWVYVLVAHAGHLLAYSNPTSALALAREFIFGDNTAGLVANDGSGTVIGGEESSLGDEIMRGQAGIYYGHATTASTYFFPSSTVAAWDSYIATATSTA
ncbi:Alpha/Beta hydrolase protein [Boletus edulis]|nr:Alpha/Beta hydrolase protein [Boletus edulis]